MSDEQDKKLEAELKKALKAKEDAKPVEKVGKNIKVQSKNGKKQ
jgi:hypothetical protein